MDITPVLTTFGLIALAELGDKTQLIIIGLAARYSRIHVFAGLISAFAVLTAIAVGMGEVIMNCITPHIIGIGAGLLFILFGILSLLGDNDDDGSIRDLKASSVFFTAFNMIALAELGDKTEIAVIALSAQYQAPVMVFLGAVCALGLISAIGVIIGSRLSGTIPPATLKVGSGILFIVFGIMFLAGI